MKKINIIIIFDQQESKEENFKCFRGKLMQKREEKALKKMLKIGTARLAHKTDPAYFVA